MRKALVLSLVFLLVGCNGKKKEMALAWENELKEKREKGIPVKCPFCKNGWGYILENESYDDPIYCIWKGAGEDYWDAWVDSDDLYWHNRIKSYVGQITRPVKIDDGSSWSGFWVDGDYGMKSGDTLETAMARLSNFYVYKTQGHSCHSQFTYNQSLDEWDRQNHKEKREETEEEAEMREFYAKQRANAKKSPEQIELEKITKELKELRKEVEKK